MFLCLNYPGTLDWTNIKRKYFETSKHLPFYIFIFFRGFIYDVCHGSYNALYAFRYHAFRDPLNALFHACHNNCYSVCPINHGGGVFFRRTDHSRKNRV